MRINIEYNFDDTNAKYFKTLNEFLNELGSVNKLWLIEKRYKNFDMKRNAGVDNCIERIPITVSKKLPYYLKTNIPCFCLSIKKKGSVTTNG